MNIAPTHLSSLRRLNKNTKFSTGFYLFFSCLKTYNLFIFFYILRHCRKFTKVERFQKSHTQKIKLNQKYKNY